MIDASTIFSQPPILIAGGTLLLVFAALAAFDGVVLHLLWFRLHARTESYSEHLWHTASAVLFVPVVAGLFAPNAGGAMLWLGVAALLVTHVVEVFDMRAEKDSRRSLGGVGRGEFAVHVAAVTTRTGAVAAFLWSRPLAAWSLSFDPEASAGVTGLELLHSGLLWGAVGIAALHLALALTHCPRCPGWRSCCATA
ncbi:MAG: hypothetical protein ACRBN8_23415 [Nannocystales bacterium]